MTTTSDADHHGSEPTVDRAAGPERMRAAVADFVAALHQSYVDAAAMMPPGERAKLPLLQPERLTVVAAGASHLHIVGTAEALPAPVGPEVEVEGALPGGPRWVVRFVDPVILPALGLIDESTGPAPDEVRRLVGIHTHLYHLVVGPGGSLSGHHAQHSGTGLAHAHAAAARDYETIRAHAPSVGFLVDEAAHATTAGLPVATALLACHIAPTDSALITLRDSAINGEAVDLIEIRRALLAAVRPLQREVAPR